MDASAIISAISAVGFPIVAFFYITNILHKQLEELRKVVETNTITTQRLVDKLDKIGGNGDERD